MLNTWQTSATESTYTLHRQIPLVCQSILLFCNNIWENIHGSQGIHIKLHTIGFRFFLFLSPDSATLQCREDSWRGGLLNNALSVLWLWLLLVNYTANHTLHASYRAPQRPRPLQFSSRAVWKSGLETESNRKLGKGREMRLPQRS